MENSYTRVHSINHCHLELKGQGRRKVPRSGVAIILYRGRAAADNFSYARSAKIFFTYPFFTYEETALVASRYFEGHALTLCIYAVTV